MARLMVAFHPTYRALPPTPLAHRVHWPTPLKMTALSRRPARSTAFTLLTDVPHRTIAAFHSEQSSDSAENEIKRRTALCILLAPVAISIIPAAALATAEGIEILSEEDGFGEKVVKPYSLTLIHFVGRNCNGEIFDSTRGGQKYLDGGFGVNRPYIINMAGGPVPGLCEGLTKGILGMKVGGKKEFRVPASLGFGGTSVSGPYAVVPADSDVIYEVEVLRISNNGPDALMAGIANCGQGGAGAQDSGCINVVPQL